MSEHEGKEAHNSILPNQTPRIDPLLISPLVPAALGVGTGSGTAPQHNAPIAEPRRLVGQREVLDEEDVDAWDGGPIAPGTLGVKSGTPVGSSQADGSTEMLEEEDVDAWDDGSPIGDEFDDQHHDERDVEEAPSAPLPPSQQEVPTFGDEKHDQRDVALVEEAAAVPVSEPQAQQEVPPFEIFEMEHHQQQPAASVTGAAVVPVAEAEPQQQSESEPFTKGHRKRFSTSQFFSHGNNDDFFSSVQPEAIAEDEETPAFSEQHHEQPSAAPEPTPQKEAQPESFTKGHRKRFSTSQVFSQGSNDEFFSSIKPEAIAEDEESSEKLKQDIVDTWGGGMLRGGGDEHNGQSATAHADAPSGETTVSSATDAQSFSKGHRKRFSTSQVFSQGSNDDFFSSIKPEAIAEDEESPQMDNGQQERKPTEEELAAKWEAEMAAAGLLDELMDDEDDLLPDDTEQNAPNNPEGGDGFLDDELMDDDFLPETPAENQQTARPAPSSRNTSVSTNPYAPQPAVSAPTSRTPSVGAINPYAPQPLQQPSPSNPYFPAAPAARPTSSSNAYTPAGQAPAPNPYLNIAAGVPAVAAIQSLQETLQKPAERPAQTKAQSFVAKAREGYHSPYDLPMDLAPKKKPSSRRLVSAYNAQQAPPVPSAPPLAPPQMAAPPQRPMAPPTRAALPSVGMAPVPTAAPALVKPPSVNPYAHVQAQQPQVAPAAKRYSPSPVQQTPQAPPSRRYSPAPNQQTPQLVVPPQTSPFAPMQTQEAHAAPPTTKRYSPAPNQQAPRAAPPRGSFAAPPSAAKRAMSYAPKNREPLQEEEEPPFEAPQRSQTQSPGSVMHGRRSNFSEPLVRPSSVQSHHSPERVRRTHASIPEVPVTRTRGRAFSQTFNYIAPTDGREQDPLQRWRGGPVFAWGAAGTVITTFPKEVPRYSMGSTVPMIQPSPGEVKIRNIKDIYPLEGPAANFPGPLKGKSKKKDVVAWLTYGIEALEKDREASGFGFQSGLADDSKRKDERILLWKVLRVLVDNDGVLEGKPEVDKKVRDILAPELSRDNASGGPQQMTDFSSSSITRFSGATPLAEPVDPVAVDGLKKYLLTGEREKAVWEAVDHRLWAHAMLIAATLSPEIYKKVAQEFIQKEIKQIGDNTESLAMLYEVFAGNHEDSIDELVPPSARAGLQMLSTSGAGPSKGVEEGLDRWRESLGLILSNRTAGDNVAIHALGKLLASYDRPEAAHVCFLFARSISLFAGVDNENSDIVLVGADHKRAPFDFDKDLESIELTEVYEYGLSLAATSSVPVQVPHLAPYKLQHAKILASFGLRTRALDYCESIANLITSQTKRSPYHNTAFMSELDDLIKRLKQSPNDQASSWIAKPTMDKVSSSVWTKFNKFVAGDDNEDEKSEGAGVQAGPFAGNATPSISRTPSVDQFGQFGQMQGMGLGMPQMGSMPIPTGKPAGRYAPGGGASAASSYTPQNQLLPAFGSSYGSNQGGGGYGHQQQMPPFRGQSGTPDLDNRAVSRGSQPGGGANRYAPAPASARTSLDQGARPSFEQHNSGHDSRRSSLRPSEEVDRHNSVTAPPVVNPYASQGYTPYAPQPTFESPSSFETPKEDNSYKPESGGYAPPEDSYAPPEHTRGYTPPAYEPNSMGDAPSSPDEKKRSKKGYMEDDEDDWGMKKPKAVDSGGGKTKQEKDREADEAFKRAAEEDAKKAEAEQPKKKGWGLGGWFKKGSMDSTPSNSPQSVPGKPIRAKLGEESSFYYDPDLKRWVNKKAGKEEQAKASATPPPPPKGPPRMNTAPPAAHGQGVVRAGSAPPMPPMPMGGNFGQPPSSQPSRQGSPAMMTPPGPPSRQDSGGLGANLAPPMQRSVSALSHGSDGSSAGPPGSGGSAPPSRPSTGVLGSKSTIDDLLGPAVPRKRGEGGKKKRAGRYIDVMADKAGGGGA